ncbi:MAG: hypothetical protein QF664_12515 [Dehalococcoidia bacterium]|nr:hypothetical protein [Dehalococcoidia bacterium]
MAAWDQIAVVEELATAGSGAANAVYFSGRSLRPGACVKRRVAALALATLFLGTALNIAAAHLSDGGVLAAALRLPLLAGNVAAFSLVLAGAGR